MCDVNITPQTLLQNSTYLLPRCVATASALGCVCTASIVFGGKWGGGIFCCIIFISFHSQRFALLLFYFVMLLHRYHSPVCLCSGTAPTFSAVEIDIGTYDCIVNLAAVLHDTALLIASYSLVTLVLVALRPFWWRDIPRAELTAR